MKIDRLFQMVYILMERGKVTAKELAQRFEVSTRTIFRDVETLSLAGMPVYTTAGRGGGIHMMEGFILDKSLLSQKEKQEMLSALNGLQAAQYPLGKELLEKLGTFLGESEEDWIRVDFSGWSTHQTQIFPLIKEGILEKRLISFDYYNTSRQRSHRIVEPLQLRFQTRAWYLVGYCREKKGIRMFKLNRIQEVSLLEESFLPRSIPEESPDPGKMETRMEHISFLVHKSQAYRVYDEFPQSWVTVLPEGYFQIDGYYGVDYWVVGYLLSFSPHIKVLSPYYLADDMQTIYRKSLAYYEKDDGVLSGFERYPVSNRFQEESEGGSRMDPMNFCQSCAMPLSEGMYGTNADGSENKEYCRYCYENGAFTGDMTMEEMIAFCVGPMVENNEGMTEDMARAQMKKFFPTLKRWRTN